MGARDEFRDATEPIRLAAQDNPLAGLSTGAATPTFASAEGEPPGPVAETQPEPKPEAAEAPPLLF